MVVAAWRRTIEAFDLAGEIARCARGAENRCAPSAGQRPRAMTAVLGTDVPLGSWVKATLRDRSVHFGVVHTVDPEAGTVVLLVPTDGGGDTNGDANGDAAAPSTAVRPLVVSGHALSSLEPLGACGARLERLYCSSNKIGALGGGVRALRGLRTLSLYRNRLGDLDSCLETLCALALSPAARLLLHQPLARATRVASASARARDTAPW